MIIVTGDLHIPIDVSKLNTKHFPEQKELTKEDFVVITGDFGGIWDLRPSDAEKYWLNWLDKKNFTTLFVDGNHENFERLNQFPVEDFHGGKAQKISDSVWHLMRGEVYQLEEMSVFALGGASSHDKAYRKEGISWWAEELPSVEELEYATQNLEKHGNKVDLIITHCAPTHMQNLLIQNRSGDYQPKGDRLTQYFEWVYENIQYKKWLFGHYHQDVRLDDKHYCVYKDRWEVRA